MDIRSLLVGGNLHDRDCRRGEHVPDLPFVIVDREGGHGRSHRDRGALGRKRRCHRRNAVTPVSSRDTSPVVRWSVTRTRHAGHKKRAPMVHMAAAEFSSADVQMMFPLEFAAFARLVDARHARLRDYLARMQARPAYRRAVDRGGAYAFDGASRDDAAPFPRPSR